MPLSLGLLGLYTPFSMLRSIYYPMKSSTRDCKGLNPKSLQSKHDNLHFKVANLNFNLSFTKDFSISGTKDFSVSGSKDHFW